MQTDVVIIGGGSAGLQAALTLGRMRFDVVVVDAGRPSNAPAHAIGGLLGAHDLAPLELLRIGRGQLAELPTVRLIEGEATRVDPGAVRVGDETIRARAVVLATGMDYGFPAIPGVAERWGHTVIHCPFCHGWEARDQRIGLLAAAAHIEPMLRRLSDDVMVFEEIAELRGDATVVLPDGTEVERDVLFLAAPPTPRDAAFAHLGPLEVDAFGRTGHDGIYAVGDLVVTAPSVAGAIASGQRAAVAITKDLLGI